MNPQYLSRILGKYFREFDTENFNVLDYVHRFGSPIESLLYAKLFWPDFTEVSGMVFLADWIEDEQDRRRAAIRLTENGGRKGITEREFNTFEVSEFFGAKTGELDLEGYRSLMEILVRTWHAKLRLDFPHLRFNVEIREKEDGSQYLTFHQLRDSEE